MLKKGATINLRTTMPQANSNSPFTATLDMQLADKLLQELKRCECEITTPQYTRFSAKKKGFTCTLYESGKLVVQGKESAEFIEFYLEPELLHSFNFSHPAGEIDLTPRIGIDESGKGDFFGPLCIAGVYVSEDQFSILQKIGVKDSKNLTDPAIRKIANEIKKTCLYHVVRINPLKYNQIYEDFKNLNSLLAWGHATTIEQLVEESGCRQVIIDQFANEWVVINALKRKKLDVKLTQRHRAEEDLPVAAASILARQAFLEGLDRLSEEVGVTLPKGASQAVKNAGREVLRRWGETRLKEVCKKHFKTFDAVLHNKSK